MPKLPRPGWLPKAVRERSAQRSDSCMAFSASFSVCGNSRHWSSCIWMSEPSSRWISMARSGVSSWRLPSICDWNTAPCSVILRIFDSDMIWKPPESVRIGRFQPMKLVQAAELRHLFGAGPQHQVIGIAEDDVGARALHLIEIEALDGADRADRHEGRRADGAMQRVHRAEPRGAIGGVQVKENSVSHGAGNSRLASP